MIETIQDLQEDDDWTLIDGTAERDHALETIGEDPEDWAGGSLFVKVGEGEYTDVLWFSGNVPTLSKPLTRVR